MKKYRVTGRKSYTCSDPDGDPKPFSIEFEADDDDEAKGKLPSLQHGGEVWERVSLVHILVPERAIPVPI